MYQPNAQQIGGTICSAMYAAYETVVTASTNIPWELIKNSAIGAAVGFTVTTLLRLLYEQIKKALTKRE